MIIRVGSENPVKVEAVQECFPDAEIQAVAADSGVNVKEQPTSLEEIIEGSRNRTQSWLALPSQDLVIGIESGIMEIEQASSGWMNTIACSIWNGEKFALGLAGGFVVPQAIMDVINNAFDESLDLSEASRRAGLTKEKKIGYGAGIISLLTHGKMARKPYIKQAIEMAMIQLNHPELY